MQARAAVVAIAGATLLLAFHARADEPAHDSWHAGSIARGHATRFAHVALRGKGPAGDVDATLVFFHPTEVGRKPLRRDDTTAPPVSVELGLHDSHWAGGFPIENFEGPDAPAGDAKSVTVTVKAKGTPWTRRWPAAGWFTASDAVVDPSAVPGPPKEEPLAFVFGLGSPVRDYRDLVALTDLVAAGVESFTIDIVNPKDAQRLHFDVPLEGASDAMRKLMAPAH